MAESDFTTQELESEEWRNISNFPGYEVSNLGRVRSNRSTHRGFTRQFRILKPYPTSGYPTVDLRSSEARRPSLVHHLVLEAFVGPCPRGLEGCHNNGRRKDARLTNLRWDTRLANIHDKKNHGTENLEGLRYGRLPKKLTADQVRAIRNGYPSSTQRQLAKNFKLSQATVWAILHRKVWISVD